MTTWTQPSFPAIAGHLYMPSVNKIKPKVGEFSLIGWQPNPHTANHLLVPAKWDAGLRTGFSPNNPATAQLAYQDKAASSTAQMEGGVAAAYLNSADLTDGSIEYKMMITPQITFAPTKPFATSDVSVALDLCVPTAIDAMNAKSDTYVSSDLLFTDSTTGTKISHSAGLFHHSTKPNAEGAIGIDPETGNIMANWPLLPGAPYFTQVTGERQSVPWLARLPFAYRISPALFKATLDAIHAAMPAAKLSLDPADYTLNEFHLNAELHYQSAPAELGWSMAGAVISY